ncbi:GNAT family N-acetyltransferase [Pseudalkalibacillus hwajinpoensis]|uniref:GNAT family N-acetyltransferase n=1 Tax=Guptibacillus hwajinpoensis TaxID=208199 RepID=A0A4U1MG99_9BACL|nr:GNAT family N-acetyltransferase [Pseudalkalibacillus hwajinpoensis]TKD69364.1 GNAT family N-acetyltransferase [Pseudalkalibacillus hwajinpoensis]
MDYKVEALLKEDEKFKRFMKDQIKEFNDEHSFQHKLSRTKGYVEPINLIVSDENSQWIGGITAEVYWSWIEIDVFWISEQLRGHGIGTELLKKVETIGIEKGAKNALLTTFEFQARTFYEMNGYQVVGEIKDYPPGTCYYTMVKSLVS